MRKLIAAVTIVVAGVSTGGTAFAGESTGGPNPKPTPIASYTAGSICSFSGQNDVPTGEIDPITEQIDPFSVGRVQSFGQVINVAAATFLPPGTKGKSALVGVMLEIGPGVSCRGYASGGGEP